MSKMEKVVAFLDDNAIHYDLLRHQAVVTTEESKKVVHVDDCLACKSLFVKDKKSDLFCLVVLAFDKRADMRDLASYVGSAKFEFATEEALEQKLGVARGSVSPFAFLNEVGNSIPLLLDDELKKWKLVKFHPCDNTATVVLAVDEFLRFLTIIDKKIIWISAK